jgi:thiol:disulfide interchange protein
MNPFVLFTNAAKTILSDRSYKLWFFGLTILFVVAYLFIPVWLTPGNSLAFQLRLFTIRDYILFITLSVAISLLTLMQVFLFLRSKKDRASAVGQGGVGVSSALFGGLLATAACSSCIAAILGFLGAGSVFFVLENQPYIVAAALALVVIALYFSARRVERYCRDCLPRSEP